MKNKTLLLKLKVVLSNKQILRTTSKPEQTHILQHQYLRFTQQYKDFGLLCMQQKQARPHNRCAVSSGVVEQCRAGSDEKFKRLLAAWRNTLVRM
jgi:hypothetical protein